MCCKVQSFSDRTIRRATPLGSMRHPTIGHLATSLAQPARPQISVLSYAGCRWPARAPEAHPEAESSRAIVTSTRARTNSPAPLADWSETNTLQRQSRALTFWQASRESRQRPHDAAARASGREGACALHETQKIDGQYAPGEMATLRFPCSHQMRRRLHALRRE